MVDLDQKKVFIMIGYPGSGKSTLAEKIASAFGCHHLASDYFRKNTIRPVRYADKDDAAINTSRKAAYELMYQHALDLLSQQRKVVLDATHLEPAKREPVLKKLIKACPTSKICFVTVATPYQEIDKRMQTYRDQVNPDPAKKQESVYDAWKRVYGYFIKRAKKGELSWPTPKEGIDIITYAEITAHLD